ncbi:phage capsid scaffolding protein [Burkholderia lata]|uniref:GPO family capsid scaffolding protein n=1 Tax=Burkholderia lata (strain ATCC 17760 / DSM 23089 / LMG 22485 / NCIMB 9086 / R18194 / 383) TaxID=482957 RepID=UPI0014540F00|nr:GPO family capsid scaffolding protein [Burkholderia lata]VWC91451.1 phage capsid scaffolding protein [Burkholderia lata]
MKFVRVATEGATTDGRAITRQQIQEMADTYNPATYGARVFLEHIRGVLPDGQFRAYGDVRAAEARTVEEGKLALFAQLDPTDDLKAMTKARQKVYTSIEIAPNFAESGKSYLVGIGVTDSPASLGTEILSFSQQHPDHFRTRKHAPENLFSVGVEVDAALFNDEPTAAPAMTPASFTTLVTSKLAELFGIGGSGAAPASAQSAGAAPAADSNGGAIPSDIASRLSYHSASQLVLIEGMRREIDALKTEGAKDRAAFNELSQRLEREPSGTQRPTATGGEWDATDC